MELLVECSDSMLVLVAFMLWRSQDLTGTDFQSPIRQTSLDRGIVYVTVDQKAEKYGNTST